MITKVKFLFIILNVLGVQQMWAQNGDLESGLGEARPCHHPKTVLEALPKSLKNWKITKSVAKGGGYESTAQRQYEEILPEDKIGTRPPGVVKVNILSSGLPENGSLSAFKDFKEEKKGIITKTSFNGKPTIVYELGDTELLARILISKSILVDLHIKDIPKRAMSNWFQKINVKSISSTPDPSKFDPSLRISINELDPKKSHTYHLRTNQ